MCQRWEFFKGLNLFVCFELYSKMRFCKGLLPSLFRVEDICAPNQRQPEIAGNTFSGCLLPFASMLADIFAKELFTQAFERAVFLQFLHCAVDFFQRGFVAFVYDQACAEFFGIGCAPH